MDLLRGEPNHLDLSGKKYQREQECPVVWEVTSRQFIGFKVCSMGENSHPTVNLAKGLWLGRSWAFEGDLLLLLC